MKGEMPRRKETCFDQVVFFVVVVVVLPMVWPLKERSQNGKKKKIV